MRFVVEIDAKTLLHQLNLPIVDLPGAMVTRWITWIRLFDFDVRMFPAASTLNRMAYLADPTMTMVTTMITMKAWRNVSILIWE